MPDDNLIKLPERVRPIEVNPGQPVRDAEWLAGWRACDEATEAALVEWHRRGYLQGVSFGRACSPTWAQFTFMTVFAFAIGALCAASVLL